MTTRGDRAASVDLSEEDGLAAHRKTRMRKERMHRRPDASPLKDAMGWLSVVIAVGFILALVSYDPRDPSFFTETSKHKADNLLGPFGAHLSALLIQFFGLASYYFPFVIAYVGVQFIRGLRFSQWVVKLMASAAIWFSIVVICGGLPPIIIKDLPVYASGTIGIDLYRFSTLYLNVVGTYVALLGLSGLAVLMATQLTLVDIGHWFVDSARFVVRVASRGADRLRGYFEGRRERRVRDSIIIRELEKIDDGVPKSPASATPAKADATMRGKPRNDPVPASEKRADVAPERSGTTRQPSNATVSPQHDIPVTDRKKAAKGQEAFEFMDGVSKDWSYPSSSFFALPKAENQIDKDELKQKANALELKFNEFGVTGQMRAIHPGPVVTTYEFKPDAGIKYSKIVNLQDDLCLALGAESIRIDRMAGRSSVGLEVPNSKREIITFREMIESGEFRSNPSKLILAMGKTIEGDPYYSNLARMPHLLIAGQTGSGKSVGINAMLCSILIRASPSEVKLILIDPKMVEMGIYSDIPHLMTPVVTDPHEAANALKWAVAEMEQRYRTLASHSFRNLEQYNKAVANGRVSQGEEEDPPESLPYVVVVIDELADLMMVARGEVEESIARIAQKSRAVGIHLILATQRPSVDIITGVIKSNLPSRLSYRVSQRNDSRIILDANGAEKLLGKGDALFLPPGTARLVRIHAPFLSEGEIIELCRFLKRQGSPDYDHGILKHEGDDGSSSSVGAVGWSAEDPMYGKAARLVVRSGQASVSYIQRKLKLGYNRAARLVDMMEEEGIVGPSQGSKKRDLLVSSDYFDGVDEQLR